MLIVNGVGSLLFWRGRFNDVIVSGVNTDRNFLSERFLHRIKTETNDKIVLISNYTQTLDVFEKMLRVKKQVVILDINWQTDDFVFLLQDMDTSGWMVPWL